MEPLWKYCHHTGFVEDIFSKFPLNASQYMTAKHETIQNVCIANCVNIFSHADPYLSPPVIRSAEKHIFSMLESLS